MARAPIMAAGGIVVRNGSAPLIAVVQLRKRNEWVLPKGKLADGETPLAAAQREVREETGQRVTAHEFLGTISYEVGRKPKVVQFWRMQPVPGRTAKPARDIRAVQWLPLAEAVEKLTHARERAFLAQVGPVAIRAAHDGATPFEPVPEMPAPAAPAGLAARIGAWFKRMTRNPLRLPR